MHSWLCGAGEGGGEGLAGRTSVMAPPPRKRKAVQMSMMDCVPHTKVLERPCQSSTPRAKQPVLPLPRPTCTPYFARGVTPAVTARHRAPLEGSPADDAWEVAERCMAQSIRRSDVVPGRDGYECIGLVTEHEDDDDFMQPADMARLARERPPVTPQTTAAALRNDRESMTRKSANKHKRTALSSVRPAKRQSKTSRRRSLFLSDGNVLEAPERQGAFVAEEGDKSEMSGTEEDEPLGSSFRLSSRAGKALKQPANHSLEVRGRALPRKHVDAKDRLTGVSVEPADIWLGTKSARCPRKRKHLVFLADSGEDGSANSADASVEKTHSVEKTRPSISKVGCGVVSNNSNYGDALAADEQPPPMRTSLFDSFPVTRDATNSPDESASDPTDSISRRRISKFSKLLNSSGDAHPPRHVRISKKAPLRSEPGDTRQSRRPRRARDLSAFFDTEGTPSQGLDLENSTDESDDDLLNVRAPIDPLSMVRSRNKRDIVRARVSLSPPRRGRRASLGHASEVCGRRSIANQLRSPKGRNANSRAVGDSHAVGEDFDTANEIQSGAASCVRLTRSREVNVSPQRSRRVVAMADGIVSSARKRIDLSVMSDEDEETTCLKQRRHSKGSRTTLDTSAGNRISGVNVIEVRDSDDEPLSDQPAILSDDEPLLSAFKRRMSPAERPVKPARPAHEKECVLRRATDGVGISSKCPRLRKVSNSPPKVSYKPSQRPLSPKPSCSACKTTSESGAPQNEEWFQERRIEDFSESSSILDGMQPTPGATARGSKTKKMSSSGHIPRILPIRREIFCNLDEEVGHSEARRGRKIFPQPPTVRSPQKPCYDFAPLTQRGVESSDSEIIDCVDLADGSANCDAGDKIVSIEEVDGTDGISPTFTENLSGSVDLYEEKFYADGHFTPPPFHLAVLCEEGESVIDMMARLGEDKVMDRVIAEQEAGREIIGGSPLGIDDRASQKNTDDQNRLVQRMALGSKPRSASNAISARALNGDYSFTFRGKNKGSSKRTTAGTKRKSKVTKRGGRSSKFARRGRSD